MKIAHIIKKNSRLKRPFKAPQAYVDCRSIYEDLFGTDMMFKPVKDIQIQYDFDDEYVTPVFRGNNLYITQELESLGTLKKLSKIY